MILKIGSKNKAKVQAVEEISKEYDFWREATIVPIGVSSEICAHPISLDETMKGAENRARNAWGSKLFSMPGDYGIGLESGMIQVPRTKTGYMEMTACAIYDGKEFVHGLSGVFEWPVEATNLVLRGVEGSDAVRQAGITNHERLGSTPEGIIGLLTKNRLTRVEYTKQALRMALIQLEFPELYKK